MANTRTYSIVINGVEQSVKAVDSLLTKLDALDQRIQKLQKLNIDLAQSQSRTSGGDDSASKSKYDAAKSEAAAQKEVADQIALQNRENQKALQLLTQKKQETKEQVRIQQQIAQGIRDEGGAYRNTLQGQRAMLSDLKKQLANTDLNSDEWVTLRDRVSEVNDKVKELEESYGVFNRNVGNYKSAAEGFQGFNVSIGETVRNFGSLKEAAKTLKNEMMGIDTSTEEGRVEFQQYSDAIKDVTTQQVQMKDAAERAATSCKGLHDALEMMEGMTAIAGIGQGISSLFGLDDSGLGEQIAKLQSLMMILQSIKTLQDQMERGVGGGGWIAKLWKGLDKPIESLKKLRTSLKTTSTDMKAVGTAGTAGAAGMTAFSVATTTATVAVKAFAKATVLLFVLQLVAEAVDLLIEGFKKLGGWLMSFVSDSEASERAMDNVREAAESSAEALQAYNDQLARKVEAGVISSAEAARLAIEKLNNEIEKDIIGLKKIVDENKDVFKDAVGLSLTKTADDAIDNLHRVGQAFEQMDSSTKDYEEKLKHHGQNIVLEMIQMSDQSIEELQEFINALNSDAIGRNALNKMLEDLPKKSYDSFESLRKNFFNSADSIANRIAQLQGNINSLIDRIHTAYLNATDRVAAIRETHQKYRDQLNSAWYYDPKKRQEAIEEDKKLEEIEVNNYIEGEKNKNKAVQDGGRARVKATKSHGSARVSAAKNTANLLEQIEKRIQNDKIQVMREGLGKTLAQLDLERRNRIEQAEQTRKELGKNNKEAEEKYQRELLSITNLYNKKEFDAKKEWADKWNNYQEQLEDQLEQRRRNYVQRSIELQRSMSQNWLDDQTMFAEKVAIENLVRLIESADNEIKVIIKNNDLKKLLDKYLVNPTQEEFDQIIDIIDVFLSNLDEKYSFDDWFQVIDTKDYYEILQRINDIRKELRGLEDEMSDIEMNAKRTNDGVLDEEADRKLDELVDRYGKLIDEMKDLQDSLDVSKMALSNPYYLFDEWKTYYDNLYHVQQKYAEKTKALRLNEIEFERETSVADENKDYEKAYKDIEKNYADHLKDMEEEYDRHLEEMQAMDGKEVKDALDHANKMLETYGEESEEYQQAIDAYHALIPDQLALIKERDEKIKAMEDEKNKRLQELTANHNRIIKNIEETATEERLKTENDFIRESQIATANYYSGLLNEYQIFQNKFQNKVDKLQEKSKNGWGIINLSAYSKGITSLKADFSRMVENIENEQKELIIKLANGDISLGDFNSAYNELDEMKERGQETLEELTKMGRNKIGEFIDSINQYIQAVGQGAQELLSTVWDAQSAALDAQQEALEKANEELDKQLQKQEDITRKHADKINEIEDELSTARGDRRQHLIDSLSAQISAQRASLAAEQRIQKQKEANEKKQDALDKKRKEQQRKQDIISATISAALATVNGLATQPFVPVGIAMGALAAALGAAQVAIIASKHYARGGQLDGGIADGPRHSQGGIKVLGGRAEIEGGEYIVNRRSTKQNAGVLEFINSKKKKLNIADFLEYYGTVGRKSVTGVRTHFADGGTLPELNNNVDWTGLIQPVIVNQDDRPVIVTVRDINNAQENVRRVQVAAGMYRNN